MDGSFYSIQNVCVPVHLFMCIVDVLLVGVLEALNGLLQVCWQVCVETGSGGWAPLALDTPMCNGLVSSHLAGMLTRVY